MDKKACRVVVLLMKLTHSVFDVLVAVCRLPFAVAVVVS